MKIKKAHTSSHKDDYQHSTSKQITAPTIAISLPADGCSRVSTLANTLDIGVSTIWAWTKNGKFPQPLRLSNTVTVWRNSDVINWLNDKAKQAYLPNANTTPANDDSINGEVA